MPNLFPMLVSTLSALREITFDLAHNAPASADDNLVRAITATVAYFDIFDFPLTDWEIYKYLWCDGWQGGNGYLHIRQTLQRGVPQLEAAEGFYYLRGRGEIVALRKERQVLASKKQRRARLAARLLGLLPFIEGVAVCNSLAYDNVNRDSDIDLFIIASAGKLWTARFWANSLLQILRLRPTPARKRDTICLSFWVSAASLNLRRYLVANDVYFAYWLRQLVPLYDRTQVFERLTASNAWLGNYLNTIFTARPGQLRRVQPGLISRAGKRCLEIIVAASFIEKHCERVQRRLLPAAITTRANHSTAIVINRDVLKFHSHDRREEYRDKWRQKCKLLLNYKI